MFAVTSEEKYTGKCGFLRVNIKASNILIKMFQKRRNLLNILNHRKTLLKYLIFNLYSKKIFNRRSGNFTTRCLCALLYYLSTRDHRGIVMFHFLALKIVSITLTHILTYILYVFEINSYHFAMIYLVVSRNKTFKNRLIWIWFWDKIEEKM